MGDIKKNKRKRETCIGSSKFFTHKIINIKDITNLKKIYTSEPIGE